MKHVAIFTTFTSADPAYSLNRVVQDQIKMLHEHDYEVTVVVAKGFEAVEAYLLERVHIKTIPNVRCTNNIRAVEDETFEQDIHAIRDAYLDAVDGVDVVITHDLIYQPAQVKHQVAARMVAEMHPDIKWLHWIHSATEPTTLIQERTFYDKTYLRLLKDQFPNSRYVFFNDWSRNRISANFHVPVDKVRTVYHPTDIYEFFGMDDLSKDVIKKNKLLDADFLCIYPARLDAGKQVHIAVELMASIANLGFNAKLVIVDFHSNSTDPADPKYQVRARAKALADKMDFDGLIFMSEQNDNKSSVPHNVIKDLMIISNVFIMPSVSESYSLVTQEAALAKNLIVVNEDFPPFVEIFGEHTLRIQVSSSVNKSTRLNGQTSTQYADRGKYFHEKALEIVENVLTNNVLQTNRKILKERNLDYVFEHQLQPLIENA